MTYTKFTAKEILNYAYSEKDVVCNVSGVLEVYVDDNTTLRIIQDGSRQLITKDVKTTVYKDPKTQDLITVSSILKFNMIEYRINGELGRRNELPAVEWSDGSRAWYVNGELGRYGDLPSIELADGTKKWYINGKLGRADDLPAEILADGTKKWYINGDFGRLHGSPAVEGIDGTKRWYIDGKLGRADGLPAVENSDGTKMWYIDGKLGRADGLPAVEWADGTKEWWVNGKPGRDKGLPAVEYANGIRIWYTNTGIGREGGLPAIIYPDGKAEWRMGGEVYFPDEITELVTDEFTAYYKNGKLHDTGDHPAITYNNPYSEEHYINGEHATLEMLASLFGKHTTDCSAIYKSNLK